MSPHECESVTEFKEKVGYVVAKGIFEFSLAIDGYVDGGKGEVVIGLCDFGCKASALIGKNEPIVVECGTQMLVILRGEGLLQSLSRPSFGDDLSDVEECFVGCVALAKYHKMVALGNHGQRHWKFSNRLLELFSFCFSNRLLEYFSHKLWEYCFGGLTTKLVEFLCEGGISENELA